MSEEEEFAEVLEIIKSSPCVNEIALFGSRSRGDNRPDSDWDIMVWMDSACEPSEEYYEKVFSTPKKFDIKVHDDVPVGSMMMVLDRDCFFADHECEGTHISSDILNDMKSLWKKGEK